MQRSNVWNFNNLMHKSLTADEVSYWVRSLRDVLKVGLEFEYNLPDQKGICNTKNEYCPCTRALTEDCWEFCAEYDMCSRIKDGKECFGTTCNMFIPYCMECTYMKTDCDTCHLRVDKKKDPSVIRNTIKKDLFPTHTYGRCGKYGVHSVIQDGSLRGDDGIEVVCTGRRVDYKKFFNMSKTIIDMCLEGGAYADELTSVHMHLLTTYYGTIVDDKGNEKTPMKNMEMGVPKDINELEEPLPQIVFANFHQLCRKYQNAITWMTMALNEPEHLTRWERYRVSMLNISAVTQDMRAVQKAVYHAAGDRKYGWANYHFTKFDRNLDIDRFHVEMRMMDSWLSPSATAAMACLFQAMLLKAVEISRYGVLTMGSDEKMEEAITIKKAMMNKKSGWPAKEDSVGRKSDTKNLYKYEAILSEQSHDLINQLKHHLAYTGGAYPVLEKLATEPIAYKRVKGASWEEIEAELAVTEDNTGSILEEKVEAYMDLRMISDCPSIDTWTSEVGVALSKDDSFKDKLDDDTMETIRRFVRDGQLSGRFVWSGILGAVMKV